MILNSPTISGSLTVTGNIIASGSITLSGSVDSASYAATASFVALAQSASNAVAAQTASFVANAQTASFVALAQSASNAVSAATASFANAFTVASTLTAQTLVVQTITSSVDFVTGSTRFGSILGNTHQFTGSVSITGSLDVITNGTEFQVTSTGVKFGNVIGDAHSITGSVGISGSLSGTSATFSSIIYGSNGNLDPTAGTNAGTTLALNGNSVANNYSIGLGAIRNSAYDMWFQTGATNGGGYRWYIGTSEKMTMLNTGQVLIGTTTALFNSQVNINYNQSNYEGLALSTDKVYNGSPQPNLIFGGKYNSAGDYRQHATIQSIKDNATSGDSAASLVFNTNGNSASVTERMRIASNGTITTSNAPVGDWGMIIKNLNTGAGNSYGLKVIAGTNSSDISFGVVNAANTFYYLRLNGNGHIKLANFSTTFAGNYHQIQNDVSGDWICQFGQNNASPYGIVLSYFNAAPRSSGAEMLYLTDSSGVVMKVSSNGNLYNLNNSYNALSDIKLKENIIDATPKLDKLMRVRIVNFNLKTDPNTKQIGVIAQELQEVFPGLIEENYDRGSDNKLNGETTLGVKYSVFVPMLIKAIQELKTQNDALQSRIETLESK